METLTLHKEEEEGLAIAALGSLFKLTEVYLSDYSSSQMQDGLLFLESAKPLQNSDVHKNASPLNDFGPLREDFELARQMNEMGLPVSFHTNKEKRNRKVQGKMKDGKKNFFPCVNIQDKVLNSLQEREQECESCGTLHGNSNEASSCTSILGQSESLCCYSLDGGVRCLNGGEQALNNLSPCSTVIQQLNPCLDNTEDTVSICEKATENYPIDSSADSGLISGEGLNGHCGGDHLNGEQLESVAMQMAEDHTNDGRIYSDTGEEINNCIDNNCEGTSGDWMLYWDNEYQRNYFYNVVTLQCTWDPPSGMDGLVFTNFTTKQPETALEMVELDVAELQETNNLQTSVSVESDLGTADGFRDDNVCMDNHGIHLQEWDPPSGMDGLVFTNFTTKQPEAALEMVESGVAELQETNNLQTSVSVESDLDTADGFRDDNVCLDNQLNESEGTEHFADNLCCLSSTKKKKRVRKMKFKGKFPAESQELQLCDINEEISPSLNKYWCQRYLLFNKYDEGIKMDEEGWFSVTPEAIAKHHALRCGSGTIVDLFTGVGGNSIQFAKRSKHVIAIDIDPKRIELAQHNAAIYGVRDQIDFIRGDSFVLAPKLKADVVFMSPPWGGPDYLKKRTFDMKTMLRPHNGNFLFSIGRGIASKVVMFLPRNVDMNQLAELSLSVNPEWSLEVEKNYLNGKLKAVTAYFCKPS